MGRKKSEYVFDTQNKKLYEDFKKLQPKKITCLAKLSEWEKENGKVFYEIEESDLVATIIQSGISYITLNQYKGTLDEYANWLVDSYFSNMLEQSETLKLMDKVALSLLYAQLTEQEILELKIDNCSDISQNRIKLGYNTYRIDERISKYIKESIRLADTEYVYSSKSRTRIRISKAVTDINNNEVFKLNVDTISIKLSRFYQMLYNTERIKKITFTKKEVLEEIDIHKIVKSKKDTAENTTYKGFIFEKYSIFKTVYSDIINETEIIPPTSFIRAPEELISDDIELKLEPPNEAGAKNIIGIKNINRGTIGEDYIIKELSVKYPKDSGFKICKVSDDCGYDFQLSKNSIPLLNIEVKVVNNISNAINMSLNELKMADKYKGKYSIYVVSLPENNDILNASYTIIKNPIETLGIDYKEVINKFEIPFDNCTIRCRAITINDWCHTSNQELS